MSELAEQPHILHYVDELLEEKGGVVRAVLDMCQLMADAGWRVTLVTGNAADVPEAWKQGESGQPKAYEVTLPGIFRDFNQKDSKLLGKLMEDADVVHLHTIWDPVNLRVAKYAKQAETPYVVSTHGMLDKWALDQRQFKKRVYWMLLGHRFFNQAASIHCTAEGEKEQVALWGSDSKMMVCPLWFDTADYGSLPGPELARDAIPVLNSDRPKVLFLSRVHHVKGIDVLINATRLLKEQDREIELIVAGPGDDSYRNSLEELAVELSVQDQVHFLGMVRGETKISLYQACDLFALATKQENFGIVLIEAMACELPVVTTPTVDISPEIKRGGAEISAPDPKSFARAIKEFLDNREEAKKRGKGGREFVFDWLATERIAAVYAEMYRDAISQ